MTQIDKYNKLSLTKRMPNNFSKILRRLFGTTGTRHQNFEGTSDDCSPSFFFFFAE